ncbi:MAG: cell wall-binding repeat-containing protein [Euzebya sp.]
MTVTAIARRVALVGMLALVASLLPFAAVNAQDPAPDPGPGERRVIDLNGTTTVNYAIRWSEVAYSDGTNPDTGTDIGNLPSQALIGRSDVFADSLSAGPLQGGAGLDDIADDAGDGRPLLLTTPDGLSADTAAELDRLGVDSVTILGNENAISNDVVDDLEAEGYEVARRLGGPTRIETAIEIADEVLSNSATVSDTAIVARAFGSAAGDDSQGFADSLSAGGWAADAGFPILLTETEVLTGNTRRHIEEAGYDNIIIVGGSAAVSDDVEAELEALVANVERVGGDNRFETAVDVAEARGFADPDDAEGIILVDGSAIDAWADGFSAANLSAMGMGWPILLSNSNDVQLPQETRDYLERSEMADGATTPAHLTGVVLICGSTVPDGKEGSASDQCGEAGEILEAGVVDFEPPGQDPDPEPDPDMVGPLVTGVTEQGGNLTVSFNEPIDLIGTGADFTVVSGRAATGCGGNVLFTGTAVTADDLDDTLLVTLDGDPDLDTSYILCIAEDTVRDRSGNSNLADSMEFSGGE